MNLKPYNHLIGYLHRYTILNFKKIHIRIHHILSEDKTPYLHNHPFYYVSIVFSGGYDELYEKNNKLIFKKNRLFSIIVRSYKTYHRIVNIKPNTKTLFFTYKVNLNWNLKKHNDIKIDCNYWDAEDGIYYNKIAKEYRLRKNGFWYVKKYSVDAAQKETKLSIHQDLKLDDWVLLNKLL